MENYHQLNKVLLEFDIVYYCGSGMDRSGSSKIKRITSPVEFDGIPNEAAWESLDLFSLTMHKPNFGAQPSEKSDSKDRI